MSKYQYKVNGVDYQVEIEEIEGNMAKVLVNGKPFEVELAKPVKAKPQTKRVQVPSPTLSVAAEPQKAPAIKPKAAVAAGNKVLAPLPGTITDVKVAVGDVVKTGDTVIVLEAMKMQNNIEAESAGQVTSIMVNKGDTVMEGTILLTIG